MTAPILTTALSPDSDTFRANAAHNRALVERLRGDVAQAALDAALAPKKYADEAEDVWTDLLGFRLNAKGQKLVTLEAMKMEHSLVAPFDGIVAELNAVVGGQVSEGTLLAWVEESRTTVMPQ